jgi:hypothetical protein
MNGMNNQSFLITQEADIIDKESKLKIWFGLEAGAGATFDWTFFDNSKLIDFDC